MTNPGTEVNFVDTTLRDGQSSLWAYGMRTDMILPVAATMDRAGFEAIEIIASASFKKCVRELREIPRSGSGWPVSASKRRRCGQLAGT